MTDQEIELGEADFAPIVETKDLSTEKREGRIKTFISPQGREYHIRSERAEVFKSRHGVDARWIEK